MKIDLLKKELEDKFCNISADIRNNNELYVETEMGEARNIVENIIDKYKLNSVSEFCKAEGKRFVISTVLSNRRQGYFIIISYKTVEELVSLQGVLYQANLFEREIADLYGLKINGGLDTRNIVKHEIWQDEVYPLRKEFKFGEKIKALNETKDYEFKKISGEGGYQISVGPVHAGIIEPGHFRFSVMGEQIENLEIRLMYKHRGIEKLCENVEANNLNLVFERIAGESSAAYGEAYAVLIEKLMGYSAPVEIKALRVVLLELERIYNYLDDIGGVCLDIGFSYPSKKYAYFSELIHQLCERITGSRFLRNAIIPLGSNIEFNIEHIEDIIVTLNKMKKRLNRVIEETLNTVSFLDRVENTGIVSHEKAKLLSMTGIVGRASGIKYDVRYSFPYEVYREVKKKINMESTGGVFERFKLKVTEIRDAFEIIEKALKLIKINVHKEHKEICLEEGMEAFAAVETVKGELVIYGHVDKDNKFNRIYIKTPSFTNWAGLSKAVLNEIVPDFPLCNKSFNMSYSENDR